MLMIINQSGSNPFPDDIINNTFHLISALNISTSWTTNSQSCSDFTRNWTKYCQISKKMFPDIDSKPNHHMSTHIPELMMCWGSAPSSATWAYEILNGMFSSFGTNNSVGKHIHGIRNSSLLFLQTDSFLFLEKIPLTILQNIGRICNLNSLVKQPGAPPEVQHLSSMLNKDESKLNQSSINPS